MPKIFGVTTEKPEPGSQMSVSGQGLSGVTGAFFGTGQLQATTVHSGMVDINFLPLTVPYGHIDGPLKIVGQSGLNATYPTMQTSVTITGVQPSSGERHRAGGGEQPFDDIVISGENFVTGALVRASTDPSSQDYNRWLVDFNGAETGFGLITGNWGGIGTTGLSGKIPSSANSGLLSIRSSLGGYHASGIDFYVIPGPPVISSVTPVTGKPAGRHGGNQDHSIVIDRGDYVTMSGEFFGNTTGLYVYPTGQRDGDHKENLVNSLVISYGTNKNNTQIDFTLPTGTGRYRDCDVVIETPRGSVTGESSLYIKYPPFVKGFSPTSDFKGTKVDITGSGFFDDSETNVYFSGLVNHGGFSGNIAASISGIEGTPDTGLQVMSVYVPGLSEDSNFAIVVDNSVGKSMSPEGEYFGFFAEPEVSGFSPTSGIHGTTVIISGTSLVNLVSIRHGNTEVTTYSTLGSRGTGVSFEIPSKHAYLTNDYLYRELEAPIRVSAAGGSTTTTERFQTTPDSISYSGHYPDLVARNDFLTISGANLELVTGVRFTGKDNTQTTVEVSPESYYSLLEPTGFGFPKTGISVRVPIDAEDGKPRSWVNLQARKAFCQ